MSYASRGVKEIGKEGIGCEMEVCEMEVFFLLQLMIIFALGVQKGSDSSK